LTQIESERDEYLDTLRRVQAEFENYRKRVIKEQTALVDRATSGLVEQLLPVLDSFELALKNLDSAGSDEIESVRKGLELVYAELLGVLEKAGLSRIEAEGKPFDPNVHEAVMQEDGDGEPVVTDVLRTGYTLKGRVLRPAMVKVTR
jgi:molecular chaperone GrpE